jgi:antitoxin MazE
MASTIARWGNSLALRLPAAILDAAGLQEGDLVRFRVADGRITVERASRRPNAPDLATLVDAITPETLPEAIPWGEPVGREAW